MQAIPQQALKERKVKVQRGMVKVNLPHAYSPDRQPRSENAAGTIEVKRLIVSGYVVKMQNGDLKGQGKRQWKNKPQKMFQVILGAQNPEFHGSFPKTGHPARGVKPKG